MYKAEQADCIRIMAVFSQDVRKTKVFVDEFRGRPTRTLHVFLINKKATSNLFGLLISLRTDLMQFWCPLCWFYSHSAQLVNQNCLCAAPERYNRGGGTLLTWQVSHSSTCMCSLKHLPAGRLSLHILSGGGLSSPRVGANFRDGVLGIFLWRQKKKRISARVTTQLRNKWVAREEVEENIRGGGVHAAFVDLAANSTPPNLFPSLFLPLCKVNIFSVARTISRAWWERAWRAKICEKCDGRDRKTKKCCRAGFTQGSIPVAKLQD